MIKVYTGFKGFVVFLFLTAGLVLFVSIFVWGIAKAIQLLLPLLVVLSDALIAVFLLGILPATFIKNLRPRLAVYSILMSQALAVLAWMVSFFLVVKTLGFIGIFLAFLFQFLAPIALAGALFKGAWPMAANLALWICFVYVMKFYSQWIFNLDYQKKKKGDIIDVDAVEVK